MEIELVNYFIKGNIALTKVDEDYPDNKLSGAVFEVYSDTNGDGKLDKDDTLLGEMKELDGGVYQMSELRYGKYLVKESKAPTGFVLDEDVPLRRTVRPTLWKIRRVWALSMQHRKALLKS